MMQTRVKFWFSVLCYFHYASRVEGQEESVNSIGPVVGGHANNLIQDLFQEYFQWKWSVVPQSASAKGLYDLLTGVEINDMSFKTIQTIPIECQQFKERAEKILEGYKTKGRTKYFLQVLKYETETCVEGFHHEGYLLAPISFMNGVHITLTKFFKGNNMKLQSLQDYKNAVTRLRKIPQQVEEVLILLKLGTDAGKTYANESIFRTKEQFERLQVRPEASEFYEIFKHIPKNFPNIDKKYIESVQSDAKLVIRENVLPAFKKLQNYIHGTYAKSLRPKPGISSIPNGQGYYEACLRFYTTLSDISPEEIHNIGISEVESLRKKMNEVAVKLGFPSGISFSDFVKAMQEDPTQQFASQNETLDHFKSLMSKINSRLNLTFAQNELSEAQKLGVMPFPPGQGGLAYYESPSIDGKRNGTFYVNLYNTDALKKFELMSLTMHEGNPGHHLQLSGVANNNYIPFFLKLPVHIWNRSPSSFPSYTAYIEGWALYAEYLGHEMGLYADPNDMISYLSWALLRASRLVVDTGIHAFDWSREEAIEYLVSNTALSRYSCEAQVDRYISWPGQATAYKMGELKIREIRKRQEKKLGAKFDVKKFHASVLSCIGPLELLETCIELEQSDEGPKVFYGKVPMIKREPKHLHSSGVKFTSSILYSILGVIMFTIATNLSIKQRYQ